MLLDWWHREITKQVLLIPWGKCREGHSQEHLGELRSLGMSQKGSDIYIDFPFWVFSSFHQLLSRNLIPIHIPTTNVQDCLFSNMLANTKYYAIFFISSHLVWQAKMVLCLKLHARFSWGWWYFIGFGGVSSSTFVELHLSSELPHLRVLLYHSPQHIVSISPTRLWVRSGDRI